MAEHHHFTREQLKATNTLVHAIVDHAPNGIITFDALGVIHSFNPKAEQIFEYTVAEVIGKNVSMLFSAPDEHMGSNRHAMVSARNHQPATPPEWLLHESVRECDGLKKGNTPVPVEVTVTDMCIGEESYFLGFIHDLTGRKQRDAQLEYISALPH